MAHHQTVGLPKAGTSVRRRSPESSDVERAAAAHGAVLSWRAPPLHGGGQEFEFSLPAATTAM